MPRVSRLSRRGRAASSPSSLVSENLNHPKNKGAPSFRVLCGKVGDGNPIRLPFRLSQLPNLLGINQPADFRMERRADMYISTLQSMIRTMGGQLKVEAVFPEGKVEINQFRKLKKAAGAD